MNYNTFVLIWNNTLIWCGIGWKKVKGGQALITLLLCYLHSVCSVLAPVWHAGCVLRLELSSSQLRCNKNNTLYTTLQQITYLTVLVILKSILLLILPKSDMCFYDIRVSLNMKVPHPKTLTSYMGLGDTQLPPFRMASPWACGTPRRAVSAHTSGASPAVQGTQCCPWRWCGKT